jgi:hypothetical protein
MTMKFMIDDGAPTLKRNFTGDAIRVVLAAVLILLVPLLAMQFTNEVAWSPLDFVVAGVLLVGTGFIYVLFARKTSHIRQRVAIGLALTVALVLVWMELAVGIFGTPLAGN